MKKYYTRNTRGFSRMAVRGQKIFASLCYFGSFDNLIFAKIWRKQKLEQKRMVSEILNSRTQ